MNVLILHDRIAEDSRPDELDALQQARSVEAALRRLGHRCTTQSATLDLSALARSLRREPPDLVFNLMESLEGQGRLIYLVPALLDSLGIPYTGASTVGMFLTTHKVLAKQVLSAGGLPTPAWHAAGIGFFAGDGAGAGVGGLRLPARCIVKSVWEEASVGIDDDAVVDVADLEPLRRLLGERATLLGGDAFAEQFIDGREFNLSVLAGDVGPDVLPPAEIVFTDYPEGKPRIVSYAAKWDERSFEYHATPRRFEFPGDDAELLERLRGHARRCWDLFDLAGYVRVDFRVDAAGRAWVLEINANPCLSPDAGFLAAAGQAGLDVDEVVRRIVADALRRVPSG